MIQPESQALLTFTVRGRLASRGANSNSKEELRKIKAFTGAINPETGKYEPILNVDYYIKNKKPFPKKYYWSKDPYEEPIYFDCCRKLRWTWEQIRSMIYTPINMKEYEWLKLSEEERLFRHAMKCMEPGETMVTVETFV